jgi:hypothetical protein
MVTVWAEEGGTTRALLVALAVRSRCDDLDRSLDDALDFGQRLLHQGLDLGKGLGGLHAVIPHPFKPLEEDRLPHATDTRRDIHPLPLDSIRLMDAIMVGSLVPIIAIDPPYGERRTDDILGHIHRQTLRAGRHIALLHSGHKPMGISLITRIAQRLGLIGLHSLATHLEGIPLPWLGQPGGGYIAYMSPLLSLRSPSPPGGDDVQVRMVLAMAPMGLDDHHGTACEGRATDRPKEVISTLHPAWPARTQHRVRVLIKRLPPYLRHGQHHMTLADALMPPLTALADPIVDIDLPAAQAQ